jgi:hypothetical protein
MMFWGRSDASVSAWELAFRATSMQVGALRRAIKSSTLLRPALLLCTTIVLNCSIVIIYFSLPKKYYIWNRIWMRKHLLQLPRSVGWSVGFYTFSMHFLCLLMHFNAFFMHFMHFLCILCIFCRICALLLQNFFVAIYAFFLQIFWNWKACFADFIAFRMYVRSSKLSEFKEME